ncbi:MAG: FAD-binding oxidoreductase [Litoreibacter sp.]
MMNHYIPHELSPVSDAFREEMRACLPQAAFRELTPSYLEEPRGRYKGHDGFLIAPDTTEDIAKVVTACAKSRIGIVPYGGGTGLVGGQVLPEGPTPVILSLERMNKIRSVHPEENTIVVEAGVILQTVQDAAAQAERMFPLSLASQGSARIGGNLATNAGGVNVLRYGNTRDLCLGLEGVMPDGTIWNGLTRLRKNNTGYDLRHLLIGAEGTLGIITAAVLKLSPIPEDEAVALFALRDPQAALELLSLASERLGTQVSAFELIGRMGLDFLAEVGPNVRTPFEMPHEWIALVDVGTSSGLSALDALEGVFEKAYEQGIVTDGRISMSQTQRNEIWAIRENIPEGNKRIGSISSHDISIPIGSIPEFIDRAPGVLAKLGNFRINCFGHVGDGNLHYNVFPAKGKSRDDYETERLKIKRAVHDLVHEMGGSVSAEHGIGRLKIDDMRRYSDPAKLMAMRAIKTALDPNGIMNPGVIIPEG